MGQILSRFDNVQASVDPDDVRNASQSKVSPEPSSDAHCGVAMQHLQVDSSTGKVQVDQNPAFHRDGVDEGKDGPEDVGLSVEEGRLDGLNKVRQIVFEGGVTFLVKSEAPGARFLQLNYHLFNTRDVEF